MEIPLNLPPGQRQQEFVDHLNAALRTRLSSCAGTVGINADGLFESTVTGQFSLEEGDLPLSWRIKKDTDGVLLSLNVEAADTKISDGKWKAAAQKFITSVLATALAENRKKYFRRAFFYYIGPQLDGEYWLPGYRFAPAYISDPDPHLINAERVVCIDQEIAAIDDMHASALADEASRRHAARLSLLINTGLYRGDYAQRWVVPRVKDGSKPESVRCNLGFLNPSENLNKMPKKGEQCPLGGYKGKLAARYQVGGELLSLPPEARKLLRGVDDAGPPVADAFDCGARLYQVAAVCGRHFPSVGLAYRVAAVDAVRQAEGTCKSFSDFMRNNIKSDTHLNEILEYLYGDARSGHFHGGRFPMGEFHRQFWFDPLMDPEMIQLDARHRACNELTREAIVNWLLRLIPVNASKDDKEGCA